MTRSLTAGCHQPANLTVRDLPHVVAGHRLMLPDDALLAPLRAAETIVGAALVAALMSMSGFAAITSVVAVPGRCAA